MRDKEQNGNSPGERDSIHNYRNWLIEECLEGLIDLQEPSQESAAE